MAGKKGFLLCVCQGTCPSFEKMNFFEILNTLKAEKLVNFVPIHLQLCADDGDEFLKILLSNSRIEKLYVAGCDPSMQRKMFRDAFEEANFGREKHFAFDIGNMDTKQALEAIKKLIKENP